MKKNHETLLCKLNIADLNNLSRFYKTIEPSLFYLTIHNAILSSLKQSGKNRL